MWGQHYLVDRKSFEIVQKKIFEILLVTETKIRQDDTKNFVLSSERQNESFYRTGQNRTAYIVGCKKLPFKVHNFFYLSLSKKIYFFIQNLHT